MEFKVLSLRLKRYFERTGKPVLLKCRYLGEECTVLLAHGKQTPFTLPQRLWEKADWVVCCHPHMLAPDQRVKHVYPDHTDIVVGRKYLWLGYWKVRPAHKL